MRKQYEIRSEIIRLRDRNRLTYGVICERARVTRDQLLACLQLRATEDALIKLDAFLDAPKMHQRGRSNTLIAHEMENLSREAWRMGIKSMHPAQFALKPYDQQKRHYNAVAHLAKFALQKKVVQEYQIVVKVPDGATYWNYKQTCLRRIRREAALRTGDRNANYISWPSPTRSPGRVEHREDEDSRDQGVVGGGNPAP